MSNTHIVCVIANIALVVVLLLMTAGAGVDKGKLAILALDEDCFYSEAKK